MTTTVVKIQNIVITPKCALVPLCPPLPHRHGLVTTDDFCPLRLRSPQCHVSAVTQYVSSLASFKVPHVLLLLQFPLAVSDHLPGP